VVAVKDDRLGEPTETFAVNLSGPTNATIADGQGVGAIVDDELRISIGDVTKYEGKKGKTSLRPVWRESIVPCNRLFELPPHRCNSRP
jgi:hypothetical protein